MLSSAGVTLQVINLAETLVLSICLTRDKLVVLVNDDDEEEEDRRAVSLTAAEIYASMNNAKRPSRLLTLSGV